MERTLVLIKPDAVNKGLIGRIVAMYEDNGLRIDKGYITVPERALLERHYAEHEGKSFYPSLLDFMSSDRVLVLALSGENVVDVVRDINGATNPAEADSGTIRDLYGTDVQKNAVHGSANKRDAERELSLWFPKAPA